MLFSAEGGSDDVVMIHDFSIASVVEVGKLGWDPGVDQ